MADPEKESRKLKNNADASLLSGAVKQYILPTRYNPDGSVSLPTQPIYGIDPNHSPIDAYMACRTVPGGSIITSKVDAQGISTGRVLYTVPTGRRSIIRSCVSDLVASATVGNRILIARILDGSANVLWIGSASTAITAAQTGGYDIGFGMPGTPSTTVRRNLGNTANVNVMVRESSPILELGPGSTIVLIDTAAIDVADAVTSRVNVIEYDG